MRWWQVRDEEREKLFPHSEHRKGRSPVWDLWRQGGLGVKVAAPCCLLGVILNIPGFLGLIP